MTEIKNKQKINKQTNKYTIYYIDTIPARSGPIFTKKIGKSSWGYPQMIQIKNKQINKQTNKQTNKQIFRLTLSQLNQVGYFRNFP